jgi:hypothetical protein
MPRLRRARVDEIRKVAVDADFGGVCKKTTAHKTKARFNAMVATLTPREIMEFTMVWQATVMNGDINEKSGNV